MSGFNKFAIIGAGNVGGFIVEELLKQKAAGSVKEIIIVTRPVRLIPLSHPRRFPQSAHKSPHTLT